jgi:hypothetical protein
MASGYAVSSDGSQLSLYSGGEPESHGGGGNPQKHTEGYISHHSGIKRHILRLDGFVGLEAGYGGAHKSPANWPQMLTVPLAIPNASACASGDIQLHANIVTGAGGGATFQLEQNGQPIVNYTLADSVLLRGNWIKGRVLWGATTDNPDAGRHAVLTPWSGQKLQVRVAMRDAELFSLSMGCTQTALYTQCARKGSTCSAFWGSHYNTIPCTSDVYCEAWGTCGGVTAKCAEISSASGVGERVCVVPSGSEPGPLCGWF